jgi:glutamate-1-semialdehyde 2,1-aminomutase
LCIGERSLSSVAFFCATVQATDANRFAIRLARHLTGRQKVLVFNYCYHGSVDETFITLQQAPHNTAQHSRTFAS